MKKTYVISILSALCVGIISALLTRGNMNLYEEIAMPPLAPPSILFPIVWTVLYALMGISATIIFTSTKSPVTMRAEALFTYIMSLAINFFWSIIFFNLRMYFLSFVWLVLLWVLIFKTILEYRQINKLAAYLQIPYLIWVTFAGYLSFSIFLLN